MTDSDSSLLVTLVWICTAGLISVWFHLCVYWYKNIRFVSYWSWTIIKLVSCLCSRFVCRQRCYLDLASHGLSTTCRSMPSYLCVSVLNDTSGLSCHARADCTDNQLVVVTPTIEWSDWNTCRRKSEHHNSCIFSLQYSTLYSTVRWRCSVHTGYVFCGTLVFLCHCIQHYTRKTFLMSTE